MSVRFVSTETRLSRNMTFAIAVATSFAWREPCGAKVPANGSCYPGMACDGLGFYVADRLNSSIRKITARGGLIETFAGNGRKGFAGDAGPATSAAGRALGIETRAAAR